MGGPDPTWAVRSPVASSKAVLIAATAGILASTVNFCLEMWAGAAGSKPQGPSSTA